MSVAQDDRITGTLFGSICIDLTLCYPGKRRRHKYRFVAVVVDGKQDVLATDVLVDPNIVLIDVVAPGGKLVVVGKARLAGGWVRIERKQFHCVGIDARLRKNIQVLGLAGKVLYPHDAAVGIERVPYIDGTARWVGQAGNRVECAGRYGAGCGRVEQGR